MSSAGSFNCRSTHKDRITRWNAEGRSGLYAGARHYLRLLRSLVKNQVPYLAPAGRARTASHDELAAVAQDTWKVMQNKWRTIPGGLDLMLDENNPLGFWRRVIKEAHDIQLPTRL